MNRSRLLSSLLVALASLQTANLARAVDFEIRNETDWIVSFMIADRDFTCPSGFRDHNWVGLGPRQVVHHDVQSTDFFFIGAVLVELNGNTHPIRPRNFDDHERHWDVAFDPANVGQCSRFRQADTTNPVNFQHAVIPGLRCERPGAQVIVAPDGQPTFAAVCWDRPGLPPGTGDGDTPL